VFKLGTQFSFYDCSVLAHATKNNGGLQFDPLWRYKNSLFRPFSFKLLSSPSLALTHCGCKISSLSRFTLNLLLSFFFSFSSRHAAAQFLQLQCFFFNRKQQTMVHTLSHTEPLQCSADGIWEACKHADEILPALMPDHFTKSVFLQGHGEPGSIRVVKMGPGMTALIGGTRY
jgi:hypothetical protein